jgi:hypothetical protein
MRENSVPEDKFVRSQPLVDKDKILLQPLHISLGLIESLVSAVDKRVRVLSI